MPTVIQALPRRPAGAGEIVPAGEGPAMEPQAGFAVGQIVGMDEELRTASSTSSGGPTPARSSQGTGRP